VGATEIGKLVDEWLPSRTLRQPKPDREAGKALVRRAGPGILVNGPYCRPVDVRVNDRIAEIAYFLAAKSARAAWLSGIAAADLRVR
jgi:hypothetical protein